MRKCRRKTCKKLAIILIAAMVTLLVFGCSSKEETVVEPKTEEIETEIETTVEPSEEPTQTIEPRIVVSEEPSEEPTVERLSEPIEMTDATDRIVYVVNYEVNEVMIFVNSESEGRLFPYYDGDTIIGNGVCYLMFPENPSKIEFSDSSLNYGVFQNHSNFVDIGCMEGLPDNTEITATVSYDDGRVLTMTFTYVQP